MVTSTYGLLVLSLLSIFLLTSRAMTTYNVVNLGAKPDGRTDSTPAFLKAWKLACGSSKPARIFVPKGSFLLHETQFNGPCKSEIVFIKIKGTIVAPSNYKDLGNTKHWILFEGVDGLFFEGGLLDGRGSGLWKCKDSDKSCPDGARTLTFHKSSNINITRLTSKDSQLFHIDILSCQNIKLQGVTILAPDESPNTDGIHVQKSIDVTILDSEIHTGDDCISIGPGTRNMWIENVNCGPGHGISIGSLAKQFEEESVQHITVKSVKLANTQNGVRIKTWARPCKSFVRDVLFQNITVENVKYPIIIDQNYCPGHKGCPGQASGVKISDIQYLDIHGTSATEIAIKFDCSTKNPCKDITLGDIGLTYKNRPAKTFCTNASGKESGSVEPGTCF